VVAVGAALACSSKMSSTARSGDRLAWVALASAMVLLVAALGVKTFKLRGAAARALPILGPVADFTLTNQEGRAVSLADFRGRVWLGDIIFTRCAGPCPKLTRQMKDLQQSLPQGSQARLVTLTTDPAYDTPSILKAYAAKFGADAGRWQFLTGSKTEIAALAGESLKLTALEKIPAERQTPEDLFIHSTIFVLVDKQARLRGFFETSGDDIHPDQVKARILADIGRLESE